MLDPTFLYYFHVNDVDTLQQLDEMFKNDHEYIMMKLVVKQNTFYYLKL